MKIPRTVGPPRVAQHGIDGDHFANNLHIKCRVSPLTFDREDDFRPRFAAHQLHGVIQVHTDHSFAIDGNDPIARLDAGAVGWCANQRAQDE